MEVKHRQSQMKGIRSRGSGAADLPRRDHCERCFFGWKGRAEEQQSGTYSRQFSSRASSMAAGRKHKFLCRVRGSLSTTTAYGGPLGVMGPVEEWELRSHGSYGKNRLKMNTGTTTKI